MIITGHFKNRQEETITVTISNDKDLTDINIDTSDDVFFSDDPVTIKVDMDDSFTHITKQSATIRLLSRQWLGDYLFSDNWDSTSVVVRKGQNNIMFRGVVTPCTYSQSFAHELEEIEINCVDYLGTLENRYMTDIDTYENLKANAQIRSFRWFIEMILGDDATIYYDGSKSAVNQSQDAVTIFDDLFVSETLVLGESEDDIWTYEDILKEILQYLNLHIVLMNDVYYIYDLITVKTLHGLFWTNIYDGTQSSWTFSLNVLNQYSYASDDTNITVADVYNQISVRDEIEELKTVIDSPFDDKKLVPFLPKQKYMVEYGTNGCDGQAMFALYAIAKLETQINSDKAWTREWWMQLYDVNNWSFKLNGTNVYDRITYSGGRAEYLAQFLKYLFETPFACGVVGFGHGEKITNKNSQNIENINIKDKYIVINIQGNGVDEKSPTSPKWPSNWTTAQHPMFPNSTDIQNCGLEIKYLGDTDATYSPAASEVTNYLVFNGEILMTTNQETLGVRAFDRHASDIYFEGSTPYWERNNQYTQDANDNRPTHWGDGNYVDFLVSARRLNNFITAKTHLKSYMEQPDYGFEWFGRMTPFDDDTKGHYYMQLYYNNRYNDSPDSRDEGNIYLSPPIVQGELAKRFNYKIGEKTSYFKTDVVKYVDVLACELKIGDKICCESHSNGDKVFTWRTQSEIDAINAQHPSDTDDNHVFPYIYLAINIDDGQFLIGDSHKIYNNVYSNMFLDDVTGMAIPMKDTDALSGALSFKIIGPVNTTWDNGIRRHPTWFRPESLTQNYISILPHVGQIWIKNLKVEVATDHAKQNVGENEDIVYVSDEQTRFISKKDDISFKFTTALTATEAAQLGVPVTANKTDVAQGNGLLITAIRNNYTGEVDKPEKFYVDSLYNEYCDQRLIVETTLHGMPGVFYRYLIRYLNREFWTVGMEQHVADDTTTVRMKEIE